MCVLAVRRLCGVCVCVSVIETGTDLGRCVCISVARSSVMYWVCSVGLIVLVYVRLVFCCFDIGYVIQCV